MLAPTPPVVLSISGSDSAGGAGAHADLRTYAALGVHGATALTVVTAQDTTTVHGAFPLPPSFVRSQIEAVTDDLTVAATKTGLLGHPAVVRTVIELAGSGRLPNLVVDPVLVDRYDQPIVAAETVQLYARELTAAATVITPNTTEAFLLTGIEITTVADLHAAASRLVAAGATAAVVKGGRLTGDPIDVIATRDGTGELHSPRVETRNDHGTGCSFAAAVAAGLALGLTPLEAVHRAKELVDVAISAAASWTMGSGHGPIDQLAWRRARREPTG
ncbi:MAG: bifunctional hydroxymethylpyrimidine kinase/phosphomethylpyrimidine kinase [Actinomycetota bacterium]|nr:bifunctional hydroxymethylpyrimidine kinase/phosphomethylpyrimidine kinase [Actinomycetota bacterium]